MCLYLHPFLSSPPLLSCISVVSVCLRYNCYCSCVCILQFSFCYSLLVNSVMSIKDTLHDFTLNLDPSFIPEIVPCALAKQVYFALAGFVFSLCVQSVWLVVFWGSYPICLVILYVFQYRVLKPATDWLIMHFFLPSCVTSFLGLRCLVCYSNI